MATISRRNVIRTLSGLGCATVLPFAAQAAFARSQRNLPPSPMRFWRCLERSLRDGEKICVIRNWQVEFRALGRGIAIFGVQLDASVDAPPSLAALAEIEENRSTDAMWPIILTEEGKMIGEQSSLQADDLAAAMETARQLISDSPIPSSQKQARIAHLNAMNQAGTLALEKMPEDLFFPSGGLQHAREELDLPGGLKGEYEFSYEAHSSTQGDWLHRASRQVITRIGEINAYAKEKWSLSEF